MALDLKKITAGHIGKKGLDWLSLSIIPTVTFIAIALITALVILPRIGAILALRKVIAEKSGKIAKLQSKLNALQSLKIAEIERDLRTARRSLPDNKDVLGAVIGIQKVALETEVKIASISTTPGEVSEEKGPSPPKTITPQPPAEEDLGVERGKKSKEQPAQSAIPPVPLPTPAQKQIDINLIVSAEEGTDKNSFDRLRNFLERLFKARRVNAIKSISVTAGQGREGEAASLSLTLTVSTFFQPLPKELGPIDAPVAPILPEERKLLSDLEEFEVISETLFPKTSGKKNPFR